MLAFRCLLTQLVDKQNANMACAQLPLKYLVWKSNLPLKIIENIVLLKSYKMTNAKIFQYIRKVKFLQMRLSSSSNLNVYCKFRVVGAKIRETEPQICNEKESALNNCIFYERQIKKTLNGFSRKIYITFIKPINVNQSP